jgi:Cys-rich protein (TIGR01571 family)
MDDVNKGIKQTDDALKHQKHIVQADNFMRYPKGLTDSCEFSPGFNAPLFGCLEDCWGCLVTFLLPCCVMTSNRVRVDGRESSWCDIFCCPNPYITRQSMRAKYGYQMHPTMDCLSFIICPFCFVNQNAREISAHAGGDPQWCFTPGPDL